MREPTGLGLQRLVGFLEVREVDESGPTGEHEKLGLEIAKCHIDQLVKASSNVVSTDLEGMRHR